jgi:phosphatidate cytidylyltransferase
LFGLLWVVWLFNFLTKIVYLAPRAPDGETTGQFYVLYLLLVTKFSDMGAYLAGSLFGRHKLVPHISPHKSWEGLLGAVLLAVGGSFGLWYLIPDKLSVFTPTDLAVLGVLLGLAAVIGDLAESIVKRSADAKDSGGLLPGIGGVLDLIDSVLFTAPIMFFYMRLVMGLPHS